jgi:hypothetical protein
VAHPVSYPVGTGGRADVALTDHSPLSSTDVKNKWSVTSTTSYIFMAWCLIITRNSLTFTVVNEFCAGKISGYHVDEYEVTVFWDVAPCIVVEVY